MSSATPNDLLPGTDHQPTRGPLQSALGTPLRVIGFWAAVVLPFVILSLLALGVAQQSPALLTALVSANVAGLVLGQDYKR